MQTLISSAWREYSDTRVTLFIWMGFTLPRWIPNQRQKWDIVGLETKDEMKKLGDADKASFNLFLWFFFFFFFPYRSLTSLSVFSPPRTAQCMMSSDAPIAPSTGMVALRLRTCSMTVSGWRKRPWSLRRWDWCTVGSVESAGGNTADWTSGGTGPVPPEPGQDQRHGNSFPFSVFFFFLADGHSKLCFAKTCKAMLC